MHSFTVGHAYNPSLKGAVLRAIEGLCSHRLAAEDTWNYLAHSDLVQGTFVGER